MLSLYNERQQKKVQKTEKDIRKIKDIMNYKGGKKKVGNLTSDSRLAFSVSS